jgi:hypothetical protein
MPRRQTPRPPGWGTPHPIFHHPRNFLIQQIWVKRRHCARIQTMSALPPKADITRVRCDVRFVPKADISLSYRDVRFTPESGHRSARWQCPLCAKSGHRPYSIISSARPVRVFGTLRPSALAVLRLMDSSTFSCLLDRQVSWPLTLQNAACVNAGLPVTVLDISAVAHQSAGGSELAHRRQRAPVVAGCMAFSTT